MNNPTRLSGFCGTPIGLKRDGARPPWSRRDSGASDYSCAYEVDVDGLDEGDLVKLKLPELPPHVRDAFRAVARGDARTAGRRSQRPQATTQARDAAGIAASAASTIASA